MVSDTDVEVLAAVGAHLGSLAGHDLAVRCRQGVLDSKARAESRRERKRSLTNESTSRWAGAITRTSEDAWQLARRNMEADALSLRARCKKIGRRLAIPVGERRGRSCGYSTQAERFSKQQRLQVLRSRLETVEAMLTEGQVSVVRGGKALLHKRNNLDAAGLSAEQWRTVWEAERLFICADGEADKRLGNETIRWDPVEGSVEIRLPAWLGHLANRTHGRYRLSAPARFPHRGDELAAQVAGGAVRYDVSFDAARRRWYLDASWKQESGWHPTLDDLRRLPILAVDVNDGHLAAWVVTPDGNPAGQPITVSLDLAGLSADARDGHLRAAISELIRTAKAHACGAFVIENLGFTQARTEGREHTGRRPSRGKRGRAFRRLVAGIPTAKFRDRLAQMASNAGIAVIAVDPAYTSKWGAQHWLAPLNHQFSTEVSGHHAAALTIGRRGLGQRARRRERCDRTRPEDRERRATDSAGQPKPPNGGLAGQRTRKDKTREARGQPHQAAQDPTSRADTSCQTRTAKTVRAVPSAPISRN